MTHRLRFSNYTDNVFRFNLYYETVNQYFNTNGVEIIDKVARLFFKMVLSILLNPNARLGSKTEYRTIVEKISSDSLFKQKFQNAYGKQNIFYKEILRSINKKRVNRLLFYRFILRIVFKIAKRGLE